MDLILLILFLAFTGFCLKYWEAQIDGNIYKIIIFIVIVIVFFVIIGLFGYGPYTNFTLMRR